MDIAVERVKTENGWTVRISTPPLLSYIIVDKIGTWPVTIAMPNCRVTIDGAKAIMQALQRAIEEAEALQVNKPIT